MKKSKFLVFLISISLLIGSIIYTNIAISDSSDQMQIDPLPLQTSKVAVITSTASTHRSKLHLYGEVKASNSLQLKAQISAQVTQLHPQFSNGAIIRKGDVIASFENTDYRSRLNTAKATLASAYLALKTEQRQAKQAKSEFKRSGVTAKASQLLLRKPQLAAANARYADAKTQVERAEYYLAQTTLLAPFDAVVSKREINVGSYVSTGDTLAQLDDISSSQVSLPLSPRQIDLLPQDLNTVDVQLWNTQTPATRYTAKLVRLDNLVQRNSRQRRAIVEIKQPLAASPPLLNGSFVQVDIAARHIEDLFALPSSTLSVRGYLWTVNNGRLTRSAKKPLFREKKTIYFTREDLPMTIQAVEFPLLSFEPNMQVNPVDYSSANTAEQPTGADQ